jgi:hypothetical protein
LYFLVGGIFAFGLCWYKSNSIMVLLTRTLGLKFWFKTQNLNLFDSFIWKCFPLELKKLKRRVMVSLASLFTMLSKKGLWENWLKYLTKIIFHISKKAAQILEFFCFLGDSKWNFLALLYWKKKVFVQVAKNPKTLDLIIGISQLAKQRTRNRSEKNVSSSFAI